ncbi:MAG: site-specific DNA-methyltransferase [Deltaproteobacteria bacterium]|jgi:site-specific DNA-methyltransferase (adenine-specific)|nr:site-specific DNA-methyltransferase [Deltaproteobacteria bacterium]
MPNMLYEGDNLSVIEKYLEEGSIDLIYLDPPFNSQKHYSIRWNPSTSSSKDINNPAFLDKFFWDESSEEDLKELSSKPSLNKLIGSLKDTIGTGPLMAYLVMMAARLNVIHRILKDTGSLYLHCDPTACHYLKLILDAIFGFDKFRNSLVWKRTSAHSDKHGWGRIHDTILFYTKSDEYQWNKVFTEYSPQYIEKFYRYKDPKGRRFQADNLMAQGASSTGSSSLPWRGIDPTLKGNHWAIRRTFLHDPNIPEDSLEALDYLDSIGRIYWPKKGRIPRLKRYLDEMEGTAIQDMITDIPPISGTSKEKSGYPTQKPLRLLARIILASSKEGDLILDPFCGSGTALVAAQTLLRNWIGIDKSPLAIETAEKRLLKLGASFKKLN